VADEYGLNANMERILKSMNQEVPETKRILELNPDHPLVGVLAGMFGVNREDPRLTDYCELLYDQGLLTEGSPVRDPLRFARLVSELMVEAAKK
jgi:molecular chaperone HtpG